MPIGAFLNRGFLQQNVDIKVEILWRSSSIYIRVFLKLSFKTKCDYFSNAEMNFFVKASTD